MKDKSKLISVRMNKGYCDNDSSPSKYLWLADITEGLQQLKQYQCKRKGVLRPPSTSFMGSNLSERKPGPYWCG